MYNGGGYQQSHAINQLHDLMVSLQSGFQKQPVTSDENKKSLLESMKELDMLAKEFAIDQQVDARLTATITEDIVSARETKNIERILQPVKNNYQTIYDEVKSQDLPQYNQLHQAINEVKKVIKEGKEILNAEGDDIEEEIISEEAVVRMKDPISKQRITEPVKNQICGHVYNQPTISAFIKESREKRRLCQCPQPGCGNKRQLAEGDIVPYPEFFDLAVLER